MLAVEKTERLRQLRAARDGRYHLNDKGRYVIDGGKRPDRRVREALIQGQFLTWPSYQTRLVQITSEGRAELGLEAAS